MGRKQTQDENPATDAGHRRRRLALIGLIAFCCTLAAAGVLRTLAGSSDGDDTTAAAANTTTTIVGPAATITAATITGASVAPTAPTATVPAAATSTTAPVPPTTIASAPPSAPTTSVAVAPLDAAPLDTGGGAAAAFDPASLATPVRWAVFDAGRVSLLGRIPTRAASDTIARKAAAIVGADNVLVGYTIDPAAPLVASGPLFVANTVLFASESARIGPEFQALLELGRTLLANNPKVSITVIGRSDSQGDPAYNLRLSEQRAQAAVDYLAAGLDNPGRVTAIGLGADAPVADDGSDAGRQLNRNVTFVVTGLLDD